jgi:type I restriction enzyme S subunit
MVNERRLVTIGELCDAGIAELQTGPFGTQLHAHDYLDQGIPIVPTEAIRNRRIDRSVLPMISARKADELARHRLEVGDILFARRGVQATGHIGVVRAPEVGFICGTGAIRLRVARNNEVVDADFLSHVLANPRSVEWFKFHAIGATMPNLNEGIIRSFSFEAPSLTEQLAITDILSTLEDKIELSRRMNETLEAAARAIFKDWFVDFGPTRAKQEGRPAYLARDVWSLFPDHLNGDGRPHGWTIGSIYEIAEVIYGAPFASSQFNSTKIGQPLIRIRDLPHETPGVWTPEIHPKGYKVSAGDVVVGMDGEFRAYLWGGADAWLNQRVCVFAPKPGYSSAFVRNSIIALLAHVEATEIATTVIHLGKNDIERFTVVLPGTGVLSTFNNLVQPLYTRIVENKRETRAVGALRDLVLPKLMSGEVRTKVAEAIIEGTP